MEVLYDEETVVETMEQSMTEIEIVQFEKDWKNSISGDEFVKRAHQHIMKVYAVRDKRQTDSPLYK